MHMERDEILKVPFSKSQRKHGFRTPPTNPSARVPGNAEVRHEAASVFGRLLETDSVRGQKMGASLTVVRKCN